MNCSLPISRGHWSFSSKILAKNHTPVMTLREPVDRFRSSFYYWRNGSPGTWLKNPRGWNPLIDTPGEFIDALQDKGHLLHDYALKEWNRPTKKHFWKIHWKPQVTWVQDNEDKIEFLCYSKHLFVNNINTFFRKKGIDCHTTFSRNQKRTGGKPKKVSLSSAHLDWIHQQYSADFVLWQKHCKAPPEVESG